MKDWIKMRTGLRHNAKVIAMARHLFSKPGFQFWWGAATEIRSASVTLRNVTRVTVCALLDVWGALNEVLRSDNIAPFMRLEDIDGMADIPGFGEAMNLVGWAVEKDGQGVEFPNFGEYNKPQSSRKKYASNADRQRAFRERKKAEQEALNEEQKALRYVTGREEVDTIHREGTAHAQEAVAPCTIEQAKAAAVMGGFPESVGELFWHARETDCWRTKSGTAITQRTWRSSFLTFARTHQELSQARSSRQSGNGKSGELSQAKKDAIARQQGAFDEK